VIEINITEENYSTMIPIAPDSTIKDVFPILQRKIKVTLFLKYFLFIYFFYFYRSTRKNT